MGITDTDRAFFRSRVYELLAHCFGKPIEEFFTFITDKEFMDNIQEAIDMTYPIPIHDIKEAVNDVKDISFDTFNTWYEGLVNQKINFFYECKYHHPLSAIEEMADIAGFYRAFGVYVKEERPDYLSMELEFMRLIALKESKALLTGDMENHEICLSAQKKFLEAHLGRWTATVTKVTGEIKFYAPMSRFLHKWIIRECEYLNAAPDELKWIFKYQDDENMDNQCAVNIGGK